ncbi:MAG: PQQ-binding-like beta-propeller repeat protein, partial [Candidatus Omnitrophica bacterium]|nr:PQQ-binding-like beta-propeller repeat protein [Candidatus Omnitrophota bacterium]
MKKSSTVVAFILFVWTASATAQSQLSPLWTNTVAGTRLRNSAAAGSDGTIYVATDGVPDWNIPYYTTNAQLYALGPDGTLKWTFSGVDGTASPPTVGTEGVIYYAVNGSADGRSRFYAVNPDGNKRWSKTWDEQINGQPAMTLDNQVLGVTRSGKLAVFDPDGDVFLLPGKGLPSWSWPGLVSPVVSASGAVYFFSGTGIIEAMTLAGETKWVFQPGESITGLAIGPDGTVYVSVAVPPPNPAYTTSGLFCALNTDGSERWRLTRATEFLAAPVIAPDGTIYLPGSVIGGPTETGELLTLGIAGQILRTNTFAGALESTPALAGDGKLWITDGSGKLSVLSADGQLAGEYSAESLGAAPVITPGGLVIVTTEKCQVMAFEGVAAPAKGWPMAGRDPQGTHRDTTSAVPPPPTVVSATTNRNDCIRVAWSAATVADATYEVWRGSATNLAEAVRLDRFVAGKMSFTDTNTPVTVPYYYWVRGANELGPGDFQGPVLGVRAYPSPGGYFWRYSAPDVTWLGAAVAEDGTLYFAGNRPNAATTETNRSCVVSFSPSGERR